jgi:hypothetical protein
MLLVTCNNGVLTGRIDGNDRKNDLAVLGLDPAITGLPFWQLLDDLCMRERVVAKFAYF